MGADIAHLRCSQLARQAQALHELVHVLLIWDAPPDPSLFSRLSRVRWLRIREDRAQRADLSLLVHLPDLQELILSCGRARGDLADLPTLPALQALKLWTVGRSLSIRGLSRAANLQALEVRGQCVLDHPEELSGLSALRSLTLSQLQLRGGLRWLSALSQLSTLSLTPSRDAGPLPSLAGLTSLTSLTLEVCGPTAELRPLSQLTALTELELQGEADLDLQPLSALKRLRRLDLSALSGRLQIGGLSGLRALSDLQIGERVILEGLGALTDLPSLSRAVKVDKQGRPRLRRKILRGNALLVAASAGADLSAARQLDLKKCRSVTELSSLSHLAAAEVLSVRDCPELTAAWSVIAMTGLTSLDLGKCPKLRPVPARRLMEEPAVIHDYRCKLARGLAKKSPRTPAEESLLQTARAAGLLKRQPQVEPPKSLVPLRRMLSAPDPTSAQQGVEMLRALGAPALLAELSRGVSLDAGAVTVTRSASRRTHLRRLDRRYWMALSLLRLTGALDTTPSLRLGRAPMLDLAALQGLSSLQSLSVEHGTDRPDAGVLSTLTGLRALEYLRVYPGGDLSRLQRLVTLKLRVDHDADLTSLGALAALEDLELLSVRGPMRVPAPRDERYLSRLTRLQRLTLGHRQLSDLTMLQPLDNLKVLSVTAAAPVSLAPLSGLTKLTDLSLLLPPRPDGSPVDLQPLAGMGSLKSLKISGVGAANLRPLAGLTSLTYLKIHGSTQPPAVDLTPLMSLRNLRQLSLGFYLERADLKVLTALPKISLLHLAKSQGLPRDFPRWIGDRDRLHSLLAG